MIRLSKPDHECITSRCWCLFELRRDEKSPVIAACVTIDAAHAARRLLLEVMP